ncbi:MAG: histidine kinase [Bdellovibrionaceae bacterium]|nr:histidine kinase [Pseudobdellovibrionaceae bacterium]
MQLKDWAPLKPFFSVVLIISTLFFLVFLQMEERRMGYEILKVTRVQKRMMEERRVKEMQLAKLTRPQAVERAATSRLTLRKVQASQIIHLSGAQPLFRSGNERGEVN